MKWSDQPPNWNTPIGEKIDDFIRPLMHEMELSGYTESQDWMELVRALVPTRP